MGVTGGHGDDVRRADEAIAEAARAAHEHATATARLGSLEREVARLTELVSSRRAGLAQEEQDVARLESYSLARIASALRGNRDADLDRERAEAQAAQYAVADAERALARARQDEASCRADLDGAPSPKALMARAVAAKEAALSADPVTAARLSDLAARRGVLAAQLKELDEAAAAGAQARADLDRAAGLLDSADTWSTYDTFLGGGLISSVVKHDRLDQAAAFIRTAGEALARFSRELADVDLEGPAGPEVSDLLRGMDIWFDNVISDLMVRSRIKDSSHAVAVALTETGRLLGVVAERSTQARQRAEDLEQEYRDLVGAPRS
ncbi:hypothetical protein GCM10027080_11250 [Pedococcus soli]